nr:daunorubicin/doxorubicin resistance ABC transporter ATP-binding protein DrrA [Solirubrobacterales bacterium]
PFGTPVAERAAGSIAVRLNSGADQLAAIVRALDGADVAVAHLALHEPTLDDVFLAKTGRSLEGAGDPAPAVSEPEPAGA